MEDFYQLLAFVEQEMFTIDQAVWLACDQVPPAADSSKWPTDRHKIAERRIRAEVPVIPDAVDGGIGLDFWGPGPRIAPLRIKYSGVRRDALIAWFRANPSFGQQFLKAVDSAAFQFVGNDDKDRITAWLKLCHDQPQVLTKQWTVANRLNELKRRHPALFAVEIDHFEHHIWPDLKKAMPTRK